MELATISLWSLVGVVALSCVSRVNVGLVALALAWLIGVYIAPAYGVPLSARDVVAWFPVELFVTLVGVTLFFSIAGLNGTMDLIAQWGVSLCGGRAALVPVLFFVLACGVSAAGAGNVATTALLAAPAMTTAVRLGISPLLMTIMVGHGSIAGTLSPLSPMGVIAQDKLTAMGVTGQAGYTFGMNLAVNSLVAGAGYVLLHGWRSAEGSAAPDEKAVEPFRLTRSRALTLALLGLLLVGVLGWGAHVGLAAFAASTVLLLTRGIDERTVLRDVPWSILLMVCGMSVLVTLCEKTGGLHRFSELIAAQATPSTVTAWMAGITGLISVFSSTSGVVLPAFLPTAANVAAGTGASVLAVATAVNIGSNLVDVSSVSTIGALCVAATPGEPNRRRLFRQALVWGLAMTVVGAAICWVLL